jgi:hypothetical protein
MPHLLASEPHESPEITCAVEHVARGCSAQLLVGDLGKIAGVARACSAKIQNTTTVPVTKVVVRDVRRILA